VRKNSFVNSIVIYRNERDRNWWNTLEVNLDNKVVGRIAPGELIVKNCNTGHHSLSIGSGENLIKISAFEVKSGQYEAFKISSTRIGLLRFKYSLEPEEQIDGLHIFNLEESGYQVWRMVVVYAAMILFSLTFIALGTALVISRPTARWGALLVATPGYLIALLTLSIFYRSVAVVFRAKKNELMIEDSIKKLSSRRNLDSRQVSMLLAILLWATISIFIGSVVDHPLIPNIIITIGLLIILLRLRGRSGES